MRQNVYLANHERNRPVYFSSPENDIEGLTLNNTFKIQSKKTLLLTVYNQFIAMAMETFFRRLITVYLQN